MNLAIKKAKETGIGWVTAKGSNHFGICQWYTAMATRENLMGMASTNTSPLVTPTRAQETVFGTNPIAVRYQIFRADCLISIFMHLLFRDTILWFSCSVTVKSASAFFQTESLQAKLKTFWKIESVNKDFLFWYWQWLKTFF